ncbi:YceI family protein [Bizionia sp. KMM 8389]
MKTSCFVIICFLCMSLVSQAQQINNDKSEVTFKISTGGIFKVSGTFKDMKGDFNFHEETLSKANFNICISAASIETGNKNRDTHLKSEDYFDVAAYPKICFISNSVNKTAEGYEVIGNINMHGITNQVTIPFTFEQNTFKGQLTINRYDYNIGPDFGSFRVGETATVTIICYIN